MSKNAKKVEENDEDEQMEQEDVEMEGEGEESDSDDSSEESSEGEETNGQNGQHMEAEEQLTEEVLQAALEEAKLKKEPTLIQSVFEKYAEAFPDNADMWHDYGHWAETELKIPSVAADVYERALQNCPEYYTLWQQALIAFERAGRPAEEIDQNWDEAKKIAITDDPISGFALYRTYIYLLRRRVTTLAEAGGGQTKPEDYALVAAVFEEGQQILSEYFGRNWDPQFEYRRMQSLFYATKLKDWAKGAQVWEDILASGGGRYADKWIEATNLERTYGTIKNARKLLNKALNSVSDHPDQIFKYVIQFEREEGTLEELDKALQKVNAQSALRAKRPQKEGGTGKGQGKQSKGGEKTPKKESNSETTGKWADMAPKTTAAAVPVQPRRRDTPFVDRKRPAPELLEMQQQQQQNKKRAPPPTFELSASSPPPEKDKDGFVMPSLPALKKGAPTVSTGLEMPARQSTSEAMEVEQQGQNENSKVQKPTSEWAVFVSNLDFKTTEQQIREILDGVVAVRFTYRGASKLHKGYAFVDLDSERHFREALAKDRIPLQGRPMLISENDPSKRVGFKYDAGLEKNKLFVRGVHYEATEDMLKEIFSQFGEVKDVRIVTHLSGQSKGVAYIEMENGKDAHKATMATDLILLDRKLSVMVSNPPPKKSGDAAVGGRAGGRGAKPHITTALGAHAPQQAGQRKGHASMISLVPRNVGGKKASVGVGKDTGKVEESKKDQGKMQTTTAPASRMSNEQFRNLLVKK